MDETLECSHPNPWLYAGVIETIEWTMEPTTVRRWDGDVEVVRVGDELMILRTASWVQTVGVVA